MCVVVFVLLLCCVFVVVVVEGGAKGHLNICELIKKQNRGQQRKGSMQMGTLQCGLEKQIWHPNVSVRFLL